MSGRYQLDGVDNSQLLTNVSRLVRRGNESTADVLAHLAEIEDRMLHLELGFPSLFAYCVETLGMSEGAAGRRVAAARVCRRFPEVFALIANGDLHLSAVCAIAPHLESNNARNLFVACREKSRRQVDELLAERFPKADVREQIRRLPSQKREALGNGRFGVHFTADSELDQLIDRARAIASHRLPGGDLAALMKLVFAQFVRSEEARRFAVGRKPQRTVKRGSRASSTESTRDDGVNATRHQRHSGQSAAKHVLRANKVVADKPSGSLAKMTPPGGARISNRRLRDHAVIEKHHGSASESSARPGFQEQETPPEAARWIRAAVRREVYARDDGRCAFVAADGRRCAELARLELDHIEPWALRGSGEGENLRLLCRAHNALHARHCFGAKHMARKTIAAQRDRNAPSLGR